MIPIFFIALAPPNVCTSIRKQDPSTTGTMQCSSIIFLADSGDKLSPSSIVYEVEMPQACTCNNVVYLVSLIVSILLPRNSPPWRLSAVQSRSSIWFVSLCTDWELHLVINDNDTSAWEIRARLSVDIRILIISHTTSLVTFEKNFVPTL